MNFNSHDYEGRDLEVLAAMPNYHRWILEYFQPYLKGTVAEFGAGTGSISKLLIPHVNELFLYEPSQNLFPRLKDIFFDDTKVEVYGKTVEEAVQTNKPASYDAIIMVNVLEHIENDQLILEDLMCLLKSGGHILLYVPALPFLMSALDRLHGHYRRYTRADLIRKILAASFKIKQCRYMDVLGIIPWYLVNTLGGKTKFSPFSIDIYDSYGIPITKVLERSFPPPFGKNLLAIAEKP